MALLSQAAWMPAKGAEVLIEDRWQMLVVAHGGSCSTPHRRCRSSVIPSARDGGLLA